MTASAKCLGLTVLVVASMSLTGCVSWTPELGDPRDVVASRPESIRVHRMDGTRVEISRPSIQNDSIAEVSRGPECSVAPLEGSSCARTALRVSSVVALQDVQSIEVRRTAWGRSVGVGLVAIPAAYFLIGLTLCVSTGCGG